MFVNTNKICSIEFQGDQPQHSINKQNKRENNINYILIRLQCAVCSWNYRLNIDQCTFSKLHFRLFCSRQSSETTSKIYNYVLKNFGFYAIDKNVKNVTTITWNSNTYFPIVSIIKSKLYNFPWKYFIQLLFKIITTQRFFDCIQIPYLLYLLHFRCILHLSIQFYFRWLLIRLFKSQIRKFINPF